MTKTAWLIIGACIVLIGGGISWSLFGQSNRPRDSRPMNSLAGQGAPNTSSRGQQSSGAGGANAVGWSFTGTEWRANSTPTSCPSPVLNTLPVATTDVTSILYPGQTRGGNYKPHGGFRFDKATSNEVAVSAPFEAQLVDGSRYLVDGETQYTFDFIAPCGLMYRLGHLLVLSPQIQQIAEQFPPAQEMDSRTTMVQLPVTIPAGTAIATQIGVTKDPNSGRNVFVDFGLYDLRQRNTAASDPAWQTKHSDDQQLAPYAVCWLSPEIIHRDTSAALLALPAGDPTSGKTSDYCR